jgi:hypothetical protein
MDRGRVSVFVRYKENTTKQFRVYTPDLGYVIRSSVVTFDELEKGGTVDLRFRGTRNTIPGLKEQKTVPKPPGQFEDYDINPTESRPTISVEVSKKSVTWSDLKIVVIKLNEDIKKLNFKQTNIKSTPES